MGHPAALDLQGLPLVVQLPLLLLQLLPFNLQLPLQLCLLLFQFPGTDKKENSSIESKGREPPNLKRSVSFKKVNIVSPVFILNHLLELFVPTTFSLFIFGLMVQTCFQLLTFLSNSTLSQLN